MVLGVSSFENWHEAGFDYRSSISRKDPVDSAEMYSPNLANYSSCCFVSLFRFNTWLVNLSFWRSW